MTDKWFVVRNEQLLEAFENLPHGDRICELYGECNCGRDAKIATIKFYVSRLQSVEHAAKALMDTFDEFGNFNYSSEYIDALIIALDGAK